MSKNSNNGDIQNELDLDRLIFIIIKRKVVIILISFVCMILSFTYIIFTPKHYLISAKINIENLSTSNFTNRNNIIKDTSYILTKVEKNTFIKFIHVPSLNILNELELLRSDNFIKLVLKSNMDALLKNKYKINYVTNVLKKIKVEKNKGSISSFTIYLNTINKKRDETLFNYFISTYINNQINRTIKKSSVILELLNQKIDITTLRNKASHNIKILQLTAIKPVSPPYISIFISTLFGTTLTIFILVCIEIFNRKINSIEDMNAFNFDILISLPNAIKTKDNKSNLNESINFICNVLQYNSTLKNNKIITISSLNLSVEKKFIINSLAEKASALNRKVLIIDSDTHQNNNIVLDDFSIDNGIGTSLSTQLTSQTKLFNALETKNKNLFFIPSGNTEKDSSVLLSNQNLKLLLDWANKEFDLIIINTAELKKYFDAYIISRYSSTNIISICENEVKFDELKKILQYFDLSGGIVSGIIFCEK